MTRKALATLTALAALRLQCAGRMRKPSMTTCSSHQWLLVASLSCGIACSASDIADDTSGAAGAVALLELPIEVFPVDAAQFTSGTFEVSRTFEVANPIGLERLFIQGHGLGYRDGFRIDGQLVKDGKGSVQLNGGPWLPLRNDQVDLYAADAAWGGIGGGFRTVRFSVPLARLGGGLRKGQNRISFRFEGTDGVSSGYRIVDLNFTGPEDRRLFAAGELAEDDPASWAAPTNADAARGRELWARPHSLASRPGGPSMRAACADCHDDSGRDLEYFSYSNRSIVSRAVFHGLSVADGNDIAAYVRSHPAERLGRPWNPPYQPRPDIDTRPDAAERWAAGGGLAAVRSSDAAALDALLPRRGGANSARTVADVLAALRGTDLDQQTINLRTIPIAIQLPDWNSWLPEVHPRDLWGPLFMEGEAATMDRPAIPSPQHAYLDTLAGLAAAAPADIDRFSGLINRATRGFVGSGAAEDGGSPWRRTAANASTWSPVRRVQGGHSVELAKRSLAQWLAVKHWEVVHRFSLQTEAKRAYAGEYFAASAEKLSWPLDGGQTVHPVAPHIVSDNLQRFREGDVEQTLLKGKYDSSAWYQLNMILDAGARRRTGVEPVDWPYQYRHIFEMGEASAQVRGTAFRPMDYNPLRMVASLIKGYQMRDNGGPADSLGWTLRYVSPFWAVYYPEQFAQLDVIEPGLQRKVVEAFVLRFVEISTRLTDADWRICPADASSVARWACIQGTSYVPTPAPVGAGARERFSFPNFVHADDLFRIFHVLARLGVSKSARDALRAFCKTRWPLGDWERAESYP